MLALIHLIAVLFSSLQPVRTHHVSPTGRPGGDGSARRPWDLATAFAGASGRITPGDTVWMHGGRYRGSFRTALQGRPGQLIVFRQAANERATIDGTLKADGAYLAFWGFEIMQSVPSTYGLEARTNGGKFINLVIHDAGSMGVSFWTPGENAELYGCIVYKNGTHENLDHGVYAHNERGIKTITDNVFFANLAYGIHVYAARRNPPQQGFQISGNIAFDNGTISRRYRAKGNILVGGDVPVTGVAVVDNVLYFGGPWGENLRLGYGVVQNGDAVVQGNFVWGGETALRVSGTWARLSVGGNTFGGAKLLQREVGNVYYDGAPPAPAVFVRPNRYEPGRAHIAIYNPGRTRAVRVSLTGVLTPGQRYTLHAVQDVFGPTVGGGVFSGDSVTVPTPAPFTVLLLTASDSGARSDTPRSPGR